MALWFTAINIPSEGIRRGSREYLDFLHQVLSNTFSIFDSSAAVIFSSRAIDVAKISASEAILLKEEIRIVARACRRCHRNKLVCVILPSRGISDAGSSKRSTRADAKMRCGRCVCANTECSCEFFNPLPIISNAHAYLLCS